MVINQGDVYWVQLANETDTEPRIPHPHVVILVDNPPMDTIDVCALTTNPKKISYLGNILLEIDEANLPKQSIVEVSKVLTINQAQLGEYIGRLSEQRLKQILAGIRFLQNSVCKD